MGEPDAFPYWIDHDEPMGVWEITHNSGRVVATFSTRSKAGMQLERLRLWWEHNRGNIRTDIRIAVLEAILEAVDTVDPTELVQRIRR